MLCGGEQNIAGLDKRASAWYPRAKLTTLPYGPHEAPVFDPASNPL